MESTRFSIRPYQSKVLLLLELGWPQWGIQPLRRYSSPTISSLASISLSTRQQNSGTAQVEDSTVDHLQLGPLGELWGTEACTTPSPLRHTLRIRQASRWLFRGIQFRRRDFFWLQLGIQTQSSSSSPKPFTGMLKHRFQLTTTNSHCIKPKL
jgi:hypothetical protein